MSISGDYAHNPRTLLHIAADLRKRGISPVDIFKRAGIPPSALINADGWVPREHCFALTEAAKTVTGERFFGASIGTAYKIAEFGTWGRLVLGAANVGEACSVAASGVGLLHQGSRVGLHQFRQHAEFRFSYQGRLGADPRQHLLGTLTVLRMIAQLGNEPGGVSVHFSMPYARGVDYLEEIHGPRLEFNCEYDAIVVDRDVLKLPVSSSGKKDGSITLEPADTAEAIAPLLRQLLPYGRADIKTIAAQQRMSTRTLQRKLRDWGFSFEEVLDDFRRTEAIKHVRFGGHSATEIALLLGYSDPAHFTRAFRRWTGMSPRYYRLALSAERAD